MRHNRWADDLLFEPLVAPVTQHRRGTTVTIGCGLRRQTPYETALVSKGSGRTTLFAQNYPDGASNASKTLYSGPPSRSQPPAENWCGINASHTGNRQTGAYRFHVVVIAGLSLMHSMQTTTWRICHWCRARAGARPLLHTAQTMRVLRRRTVVRRTSTGLVDQRSVLSPDRCRGRC